MHHHQTMTRNRLKIAAGVTGLFVVVEFFVGWSANSLALMSDAGHNLADVAALVLSAWAFAMVSRPPDPQRTFGYHRVGVLAALANAMTLILLAVYIFFEGAQRLVNPERVSTLPMIVVALVAVVLNAAIALDLRQGTADVNVRAAFIHMVGDAASSVGVILAGIGIWLTGSTLWDPIVSLLIGAFIVWSSWSIIRETVNILLESTPQGIDLDALARDVAAVSGVANIHDLHVWSLSSNVRALAAHIALENATTASAEEIQVILTNVRHILRERYHIDHTTLETHCVDELSEIRGGLECPLDPERFSTSVRDHVHSH